MSTPSSRDLQTIVSKRTVEIRPLNLMTLRQKENFLKAPTGACAEDGHSSRIDSSTSSTPGDDPDILNLYEISSHPDSDPQKEPLFTSRNSSAVS